MKMEDLVQGIRKLKVEGGDLVVLSVPRDCLAKTLAEGRGFARRFPGVHFLVMEAGIEIEKLSPKQMERCGWVPKGSNAAVNLTCICGQEHTVDFFDEHARQMERTRDEEFKRLSDYLDQRGEITHKRSYVDEAIRIMDEQRHELKKTKEVLAGLMGEAIGAPLRDFMAHTIPQPEIGETSPPTVEYPNAVMGIRTMRGHESWFRQVFEAIGVHYPGGNPGQALVAHKKALDLPEHVFVVRERITADDEVRGLGAGDDRIEVTLASPIWAGDGEFDLTVHTGTDGKTQRVTLQHGKLDVI